MPSLWVRRSDGSMGTKDDENKDGVDDIEFKPEKLKEDITKEFDTKFTTFQTAQDAKMKPLLDMAEQLASDRAAAAKRIKDAEEKKNKEENAITHEDFLLDSADATRRIVQEAQTPVVAALKMTLAKSNLREVMENKPYYHGEIKSKVDAMVLQQSLDNQCRADVVENCYKAIVFDHMEDIKEGKIKSKTSSATFEGGSTGGHKADTSESVETMTEDETKAAAAMGIKKDDWIKSRKELTYV